MAYLWVKDQALANDLLQQVFEKAWNQRNDLQQMDNPTGWMVRTLKNESLQHFRISKKMEALDNLELEATAEEESEEQSKRVALVFKFLEKLPEKQREIFHLREVEGLTYEEIADYLEISLEQVKVNLFRARQQLKTYLTTKK